MAKPQNPHVKLYSASLQAVSPKGKIADFGNVFSFIPETEAERAMPTDKVFYVVYARAMESCRERYPIADGWHSHSVQLTEYAYSDE